MTLTIQQQQELRHVEAFDLATFLQGFEQAVKDGYSLSLEYNETYPYGTIGHYIVKMPKSKGSVKQVKEPVKEVAEQQTTEGTQEEVQAVVEAPKKAETATQDVKAKPGRPAKGK